MDNKEAIEILESIVPPDDIEMMIKTESFYKARDIAIKVLNMIQNTDETSATKCFETINKIKRGELD